jgi:hypothetical protein
VRPEDLTEETIVKAMWRDRSHYGTFDDFAHDCHAVSWGLIRSGLLGTGGPNLRVARGACRGVGGQHSWVVMGDPYDETATIVDLTLWSYDAKQPRIWIGSMLSGLHRPKGFQLIFDGPKPDAGSDPPLLLDTENMSDRARTFIQMIGPLDARGWVELWSRCGMLGWPSAEILDAFLTQYPDLTALVPIDIVGMVTDRNPQETYW